VDDEATIVKILTKRLVGSGYVVLSAANGPEAGESGNAPP